MFDIEILRTNYGVSYGSVALKSLQNDNVPELDLLVREAIQNSSDASLREPGESFAVHFKTGSFQPSKLNVILWDEEGKIEKVLNERYPKSSADFLEVRDTKTCGLNGCMRKAEIKNDDHGNFFKLIFDTGKRQNISNAGGNWGFGKSVYYRVGIGIVIFYSRTRESAEYQDRLIITLMEDESKRDDFGNDISILGSVDPRSAGKAWWGKRDGEDLLPLLDRNEIQMVLSIFGIKPFGEAETGTSIIIPYLKTQELLEGIIPPEAELEQGAKDHLSSVWLSSVSDYLTLSIQKWYAPKVHNREIPGISGEKWLQVYVNNCGIIKSNMLPFFDLVQELYLSALAKAYDKSYKSKKYPQIKTLPVNVKEYFEDGMQTGFVSFIRITKQELNGEKNLLNPYLYIGEFEMGGNLNDPIVMYARDPGMIIDYCTTGAWVKKLSPSKDMDEYLFAFFVPMTKKVIKKNLSVSEFAGMNLGEYLRACEASDHMAWNDPVKMQIVKRMQTNLGTQINKQLTKDNEILIDASASKLAGRLGKNLLPRVGYGKQNKGGGGENGSAGGKINNAVFQILSQERRENVITLFFSLELMHGKKSVSLYPMIASEDGYVTGEAWRNQIGTIFPLEITECEIDLIKTSVSERRHEEENLCCHALPECRMNEVTVILDENNVGLCFQFYVMNPKIEGKIRIKTLDRKYRFAFKME